GQGGPRGFPAAHRHGPPPSDREAGTVTFAEVAREAHLGHDLPIGMAPGLDETHFFDPVDMPFAYSTHIHNSWKMEATLKAVPVASAQRGEDDAREAARVSRRRGDMGERPTWRRGRAHAHRSGEGRRSRGL